MSAPPGPAELSAFAEIILQSVGLDFAADKRAPLADLLRARVHETGLSVRGYLEMIRKPERSKNELRILAQELTITETSFFRNPDQIDAFAQVALPDRIAARSDVRRLRLLSAGCSSGEEAYTLAACVQEHPALAGWDVPILGIDISSRALKKARTARYSPWSLRQTPSPLRARLFKESGGSFLLDRTIRERVSFEERNLTADDPLFWHPRAFDIIFCRNVLMYFSVEVARSVVARLARSLAPGGFLFLGHAETLRGLSSEFSLCQSHGTFYYRREPAAPLPKQAGAVPASPPSFMDAAPVEDRSWFGAIHNASRRIETITARTRRPRSESQAAPESHRSDAAREAAIDLLRRERYAEARELLSALPVPLAREPGMLLLKAVIETHVGDLPAAERTCEELLWLDPGCAGAHYLKALCRESASDSQGAVQHNRAAARLDPDFAMPRLHLGLLSRRAGDSRTARDQLRQALALLDRNVGDQVGLFGGGFSRSALMTLCRTELAACGGAA
ncbi:CheR family methyltransferase [Sphingomonas soli]|uniref:CheR family methyltransferase n=1 Tax=Sphingomonas soli TaxID=266127 RepID=UPI00082A591F|nr:protein-glutamate O-methyltransferase CheR [Sphingomonas soli]